MSDSQQSPESPETAAPINFTRNNPKSFVKNLSTQQNEFMDLTQGGESEYLQGVSQVNASPTVNNSPYRRASPSKFQMLQQNNIHIKAFKLDNKNSIQEFAPTITSPPAGQKLHTIDMNKSTQFQITITKPSMQLRQLPLFAVLSNTFQKGKSNRLKLQNQIIQMQQQPIESLNGVDQSYLGTNPGDHSNWSALNKFKSPMGSAKRINESPHTTNAQLIKRDDGIESGSWQQINSFGEIIDGQAIENANQEKQSKVYMSLKKSDIQMPIFLDNFRPFTSGVQTGGPTNPHLKQQIMAMRMKINKLNNVSLQKEGAAAKTISPNQAAILRSQTPNNLNFNSRLPQQQFQMDDTFSTHGIQLRIKTPNTVGSKDHRQRLHIKMTGENFLDKSPSEELKSDEDNRSLLDNMGIDSLHQMSVKHELSVLISPSIQSPKVSTLVVSPKHQQLINEAYQQVQVSANISKSLINQQQRRIQTPSHYHNHAFYKAQRNVQNTSQQLSGQTQMNQCVLSPIDIEGNPDSIRCMTAFGKSVNIQRNKKPSNVREPNIADRIHVQENKQVPNKGNIIMGTVELIESPIDNQADHQHQILNTNIIQMPMEVPLQRNQLHGSKRSTPKRQREQNKPSHKSFYAVSPMNFTSDLKSQLQMLKVSQPQLQQIHQLNNHQSKNNDIIPVLSQFNHRIIARKAAMSKNSVRRRDIKSNLLNSVELGIDLTQTTPKSHSNIQTAQKSPKEHPKPQLMISSEKEQFFIQNENPAVKASQILLKDENPFPCTQSVASEQSPIMKEYKSSSQPVTPQTINLQQMDQMRLSQTRRLLIKSGKKQSRFSSQDVSNPNSKLITKNHLQNIKEFLNQTGLPSRHQQNSGDMHNSSIFLSAFLEKEQNQIQATSVTIVRAGTKLRTPGMLFNQNRLSQQSQSPSLLTQKLTNNLTANQLSILKLQQTPMNPSIVLRKQPAFNLMQTPVAKHQHRQFVSPSSLLNDYSIVKQERNLFKELKGDKQMVGIVQAANQHMYSSVVKANREQQLLKMQMMQDQDEEHVVTE